MWNKFSIIVAILILGAVFKIEITQWYEQVNQERIAQELIKAEKLRSVVEQVNKQLPTEIHSHIRLVSLDFQNTQVIFLLEMIDGIGETSFDLEKIFLEESRKVYCSSLNFMQLIRSLSQKSTFQITMKDQTVLHQEFSPNDCLEATET